MIFYNARVDGEKLAEGNRGRGPVLTEGDFSPFQTEDTILYAACFDANGGVFEPLFG
jgi:hypothetical protein